MINEDLYHRLLAYSITFCRTWPWINPVELVHDIISEGGVTEGGFAKIFTAKKYEIIEEYNNKPVPLFVVPFPGIFSPHQYCYDCQDYLPMDMFHAQGVKLCKHHRNRYYYKNRGSERTDFQREHQQKTRDEIRDSYVIDVLKKNGFKREDITDELIAEKKKSLYLKRLKKTT